MEDVKTVPLGRSEEVPIPAIDAPYLLHDSKGEKNFLKLPAPTTALIKDPLYSSKYQILFLTRHRLLADTINDRYPFRVGALHLYGQRVTKIPGYATSLRGRWNNYYHLLVDVLPRLDLLRHPYFDRFEEISIICPGGLTPLEEKLLGMLGMPPRSKILTVAENALYQPENYIFLSYPTLPFCGALPSSYVQRLRDRVVPVRPSRHCHRILISRQRAVKRRMLNFDDLAAALQPLGFEVIELETLDYEAQVELFYDAEIVVGSHGAGLTNVLFSERTNVVEIFPSWYVLPHYLYLCQSLGHPYRFIVSSELPEGADLAMERLAVLNDLNRHNDGNFEADVGRVFTALTSLGYTKMKAGAPRSNFRAIRDLRE